MNKTLIIGGVIAIIIIVIVIIVVMTSKPTTPAAAPKPTTPAVSNKPTTPAASSKPSITTAAPVVSAPVVVDPPYNRVKYFRIQRVRPNPEIDANGKNTINIAELEFFDENNQKVPASNILNASYNDGGIGFNPFASVNTVMNDFAHTSGSPDAYIQIAFKEPVMLSRAVITNRVDCCKQRMMGTQVQTFPTEGDKPYTTVDINDARDTYTINYTRNSLPSVNTDNIVKGTNGWNLVRGIPVALRVNQNGDLECAATNGRDCLWRGSDDEVLEDIKNPSFNASQPLACGQGHKSAWGGSGYENGNHWCVKGISQLNPTSPKINPMPASFIRYARNYGNYLQY